PRPLVTVSPGLAVSSLGPGSSPASTAPRTTASRSGFADAALTQLVKPCSSSVRAQRAVRSVCSSGGVAPRSVPTRISVKERCACGSIRPGIRVAPRPCTPSAPSGSSAAFAGATAAIRLPLTRTWPAKGGAPLPSRMSTSLNSTARIGKLSGAASAQHAAEVVPRRLRGAAEKQQRRLVRRQLAAVRNHGFRFLAILDACQIFRVCDVAAAQPVLGLGSPAGADAADLIEVRPQLGIIQIQRIALLAGAGCRLARVGHQRAAERVGFLLVEACLDRSAAVFRRGLRDGDLDDQRVGAHAHLTWLLALGIDSNEPKRLSRSERLCPELTVVGRPQAHDRVARC